MRTVWACLFTAAAVVAAPVPDWGKWEPVRATATLDAATQRNGQPALRVQADGEGDAWVRSAPVSLVLGRHYELSGWVRTENVRVRDLDRSPIAVGATLAMASMPFDV